MLKPMAPTNYHNRKWNKKKIKDHICQLEHKMSTHNKRHNRGLYEAAMREFGSWSAAVEAAGFDYAAIKKKSRQEYNRLRREDPKDA